MMTRRVLDMNSHAARWLDPKDREAIERAIPDGYRMTVMYGTNPGDWSIRIFELAPHPVAPVIVSKHHRTIVGGAFVALAKLAEAGAAMTVTVDLDGTPTLHGWEDVA